MTLLTVLMEEAGMRLDTFIAGKLDGLSRASVQKLCAEGLVRVNGKVVEKTGVKLRISDEIEVNYDSKIATQIPQIDLPVIYEDDDCLVIDKPAGILTHSKGAFNPEATVATFIRPKITGMTSDRAGIVHRLDRATSGLILCAKHPDALHWFQKQFSLRKVKKTYMAVVEGVPKESHAIIDMPIERNPKRPQTFRVGANGKSATTEYRVLKVRDNLSLLELSPKTGRTHQLRVHLHHLGHPIVGDTLYGGREATRLLLHALQLEITLTNSERKLFASNLPAEFKATMVL